MKPIFVTSSSIDAVAYEAGILYIRFKKGAVYKYEQVPAHVAKSFLDAESTGKAFHALINKHFVYAAIADPFDEPVRVTSEAA